MKQLKKFEFKQGQFGGEAKYDWAKLLNGNIWQLVRGEDYTAADTTIMTQIRMQAGKRGLAVSVNKTEDGIVLQASGDPDPEKAAAYKAHRKELTAARKARKAAAAAETSEPETQE
jgi:hypothetical protein